MGQTERLTMMAEDELAQYSTDARKIEKLRRKIGISVSREQQQQVKQELLAQLPDNPISQLVERQRQTVALPFWGIAGLGLLFGVSMSQPFDFILAFGGGAIAFKLQQWGWKLQAKRLILQTLEEIERQTQSPNSDDINLKSS